MKVAGGDGRMLWITAVTGVSVEVATAIALEGNSDLMAGIRAESDTDYGAGQVLRGSAIGRYDASTGAFKSFAFVTPSPSESITALARRFDGDYIVATIGGAGPMLRRVAVEP